MQSGAVANYIDAAQLALYAFWFFFAGLVYYLHRENKREGYPLESDRSAHITVQGWPAVPEPKSFLLPSGETNYVPSDKPFYQPPLHEGAWRGEPLEPTGNPLLAGVGPGSWNQRADVVDMTYEGVPKIVPLRAAPGFGLAAQDTDPRGLPVIGDDGVVGGTVVDVWVDRSEVIVRYLEVETDIGRQVLLPMNFARVQRNAVKVKSILGHHFVDVPLTRQRDQLTLLEEEKIMAYYGAGTLYATPSRREPLI